MKKKKSYKEKENTKNAAVLLLFLATAKEP